LDEEPTQQQGKENLQPSYTESGCSS